MDMLTSLGITKDLIADLIINIGSIVVLFVIVKKLAYKPIKKFMDERTERLSAKESKAEALSEAADKRQAEYTALLAECDSAKEKAITEGESIAHKKAEEIITDAQKTAEEIIRKAKFKAEEDYQKMMEDATDYIVSLAMEASSVLLKRTVNDDDNRKIVEEFLGTIDGDENA